MKTIAMPFHRLVALSILITASGCFPTQLPGENPFEEDKLAFIEIGKTTMGQVDAEMSNLTISTDEVAVSVSLTPTQFRVGFWWLYSRDRRSGQIWPGVMHDFLLIKFDMNGVVYEYEASSMKGQGCNQAGVCKLGNFYMLFAPEGEDQLAKQFQPPGRNCGIYLYVDVRRWMETSPLKIGIDHDPGIDFFYEHGFLYWEAPHGWHQVKFARHRRNQPYMVSDIDCGDGEVFFIKYGTNWQGLNSYYEFVEDSKGRREIEKRRLVVMD